MRALQDRCPQVKLDAVIVDYILDLVEATRENDELHLGVSPRGALALTQATQASALLNGRFLRLLAQGGEELDWSAISQLAAADAGLPRIARA